MHSAASHGHITALRELLKDSGRNVNERDEEGRTPLYEACKCNHLDTARMLVKEFGARVDIPNIYGRSPLHRTVEKGHTEIVRALVTELGADVNTKDKTPLSAANEYGHIDAPPRLPAECVPNESVNENRDFGFTPLHDASWYASLHGHVKTVRMLLELGAEVTVKSNRGCTPLHEACQGGSAEAVRVLVDEFGADVNVVDNEGHTPLHMALLSGKVDVVRALQYGAV